MLQTEFGEAPRIHLAREKPDDATQLNRVDTMIMTEFKMANKWFDEATASLISGRVSIFMCGDFTFIQLLRKFSVLRLFSGCKARIEYGHGSSFDVYLYILRL